LRREEKGGPPAEAPTRRGFGSRLIERSLAHDLDATQRVLTQTLRKLERNGMVTRRVLDGRVLGVEYALTPLGRSLQEPFSILFNWTVENIDVIQDCQRRFDANADRASA
jgi:DNA-binding HxlR family transcriptional regulator